MYICCKYMSVHGQDADALFYCISSFENKRRLRFDEEKLKIAIIGFSSVPL